MQVVLRPAVVQRRQVEPHQAHVVVERHPVDGDIVGLRAEPLMDGRQIGGDVALREHDAFGLPGAAGRELDEGGIAGTWPAEVVVGMLGQDLGERPPRHSVSRGVRQRIVHEDRWGAEHVPDVAQPRGGQGAPPSCRRGRHRYRNDAAKDASPERREERLGPGERQHHVLARPQAALPQATQHAGAAHEQRRVGFDADRAVVVHVPDAVGRRLIRGVLQETDQIGHGPHRTPANTSRTILTECRPAV
jgi:hypothetical protein